MSDCTCGNTEFGFNCVCDWVKAHPGSVSFTCEFCGLYTASAPKCNKCEAEVITKVVSVEDYFHASREYACDGSIRRHQRKGQFFMDTLVPQFTDSEIYYEEDDSVATRKFLDKFVIT